MPPPKTVLDVLWICGVNDLEPKAFEPDPPFLTVFPCSHAPATFFDMILRKTINLFLGQCIKKNYVIMSQHRQQNYAEQSACYAGRLLNL